MPLPAEIPTSRKFGPDRQKEIHTYVEKRIQGLLHGLRTIREQKYPQWRRIYAGTPREPVKSFPWQNASNLVPQLVGASVDQLTARIVMGIFGTDPLWVTELVGDYDREEKGEEQRDALERALSYFGRETRYLNLLLKYEVWVRTFIRYGLGAMKFMPEMEVDQVAESIGANGQVHFTNRIRHDGPVALPLQFDDFLIPPTVQELTRAPGVAQRVTLLEYDMKGLLDDPTYNKTAVEYALTQPDRAGPDMARMQLENDTGARTEISDDSREWDLYEYHFRYRVNGDNFNIISTYHYQSKKVLKQVFNWLPENSLPFLISRLTNDNERTYGMGFAEMLKDYQEEVAAIHNQRRDAATLANTMMLRVAPGTQLDSQFSIYPTAILAGEDGQIEAIPIGRPAQETIKDEQMVLQMAQDRAGIGPSSSGSGAGTVSKKGVYSAMGTFAVMQEGNTRANLNVTEFRHAHYELGRLATLYYSRFGLPQDLDKAFGKMHQYLDMALKNYEKGRMTLPIRAASGSVNKEVEKQNDMLMLNNVRAHWQMVTGLLQQISNPMMPPESQLYMLDTINSANILMSRILRNFGIEDAGSVVPDPLGIEERAVQLRQQLRQQHAQQSQGQQQPGGQPQLPAQASGGQPQPNPTLNQPEPGVPPLPNGPVQ
jgi:hypothetical protein